MKVTLFVRTFVISANRDALQLAYDFHYFWQGENYHHIYRGFMDKIWSRGRMPDQDSAWLLNECESLGMASDGINMIDVSTISGRALALWWGMWKFPGMMLDDEKMQGRKACEARLKSLQHLRQNDASPMQ